MRIIQVGTGKKRLELVSGLQWHPLMKTGSARVKELTALAQAAQADFKVIRGTQSVHVGFANRSDGAKAGQLAAAAVIADVLVSKGAGRSLLAAVRVPGDAGDAFLYVQVRDGVILAEGDRVGERDAIRVLLGQHVSFGGWDTIVCPGEWSIPNSKEHEFDFFFNPQALWAQRKKWALAEISIAWKKALIPAALILALAAGGTFAWKEYSKKKAAAAEALRIQEEEVARGQRMAPKEPPKPWPAMPYGVDFAYACSKALKEAGVSAGNWQLSSIDCESGSLTVRWVKADERAWISHLLAVRPDARFLADGMSASITVPAPAASSNDFAERLPSQEGVRLRYYDLASRYGMSVRIDPPKEAVQPQALPGQAVSPAAMVTLPSWTAMPVSVTTNIDPVQAAAVLAYPGLRFQKLSFSYKAGVMQFQFSGVQYVRS